ncbi:glucosamine-6-phosphate deaminase [Porifericola rhodea]|uniref:glucosamine-6-phosphate deaminase n=1 Tax=Porifericola rhodea TaxID=930972 RepID=UPI00266717EF|nr:glucosamine-6-phosphate deaminase [Porifericola rhodea]WKN30853.1 glucosamine-6-phosphate deaminase [Porifericola rhodea]
MKNTIQKSKFQHLNLEVYSTRQAMGEAAGKAVEQKIIELLQTQNEVRMIFAAAPSQNDILSYLRTSEKVNWQKIVAFHMDEYIGLSESAPQLFSNYLREHLFDHVNLKEVHLIDGNLDANQECIRYAKLIAEKEIDIVCLGIGENGHIAFNDPPVADFNDFQTIKVVELDDKCRQQQVNDGCFQTIDKVPTHALTLTIPTLMSGKYLYCVVPGSTKSEAVKNTLHKEVSTKCPSSILKTHPNCTLYVDEEAYALSN